MTRLVLHDRQHYAPRLEGGATVGIDGWFADPNSAERPANGWT